MKTIQTDICLIGSGPASCTYARTLLDETAGTKIVMVEMGSQHTTVRGANIKNNPYYQKRVHAFQNAIVGHLEELEPGNKYLPGASATFAVGGMGSHWTCTTPRPHEDELPDSYPVSEWNRLYSIAEGWLGTTEHAFDDSMSQRIIKNAFEESFPGREIKGLPMAVKISKTMPYLRWAGCDTIMGKQFYNERLALKADTHCSKLIHSNGTVTQAVCTNQVTGEEFLVEAKTFVIGAGAILSPQLLFSSGLGNDNVGRYLSDHPTAFCQVILHDKHLDWARKNPDFNEALAKHRQENPQDKVPIPFNDPDPQLYTPYSRENPWHTQIHREAFHYGQLEHSIDNRLVVHFRWFGKHDPAPENRVTFNEDKKDIWGMPSPSFYCKFSDHDNERMEKAMIDMTKVSQALGTYIPGVEPHMRPYGQSLHACGTTRVGHDPVTSVLDPSCKVWGTSNLWVAGNNVIPTANSVNPTLTTMAYARRGAEDMIRLNGWEKAQLAHL
ncbi:FAD/NAD(P)-binding domain-containing protein [Meredithblackwellia eburnea MCA 4105]